MESTLTQGLIVISASADSAGALRTLVADQDAAVEQALWSAMRTMEERANTLRTMAKRETEAGRSASAAGFEDRAAESRTHAKALRKLLLDEEAEELEATNPPDA